MRTPSRRAARRTAGGIFLAALLAAGCGDAAEENQDLSEGTAEITVAELGTLGAQVYLEPERAEELITEAGITPAEFETRVRAITDDPELSLTYAEAFEAEIQARDPDSVAERGDPPSSG